MNKKTLRKELELKLLKGIEETLIKQNSMVGKNIHKITRHASKTIAKKFYKTIKASDDKKTAAAAGKTKTLSSKISAKPAITLSSKAVKKTDTKLKSKNKK